LAGAETLVRAAEEEPTETAGGPVGRLFRSIRGLFATLLTMGHTRLELLTVELELEAQRLAVMVVLGIVALLGVGFGVIFAGMTVIVVFWDTHRILAAVFVTIAFLGTGVIAALRLAGRIRTKPKLLAGTLAELAADARRLRGSP